MRNPYLRAALALVLLSPLASACRKPAVSAQTSQEAAAAPPAKPVPETLPDVLARVNGEDVTKAQFEKFIGNLELKAGAPVPADRRNEVYRSALDQIVDMRLLVQEVKARKIQGDVQMADSQLQGLRSRFPSEEAFTQALATENTTVEKLKTDLLTQSGINQLLAGEQAGAAEVTDADVKTFYDQNPDKFKRPEQVRASHILFKADSDLAAKKKARATAETVLKEAKGGKDFGALAKQHSSDGSASQGGDLGFFEKERMVPEFSNAAFALQPGQISDIVESQFGYHIIKVTDRKAPETIVLDEVAPQVKQYLTQQRRKERTDAFVKQLRSKAKIEVLI